MNNWDSRMLRLCAKVCALVVCLSLVTVGTVISKAKAQPLDSTIADFSAAIDKLQKAIKYEVEAKQLPGFSIVVVADGRKIWSEGFGFSDAESKIVATPDTIYRVGSISKLLTDVAVMQLVEKGELNLDAPIQQYLPTFAPHDSYGKAMTLRHLMSHQSGLVRESPVGNYFDNSRPTLNATVESLNKTSLVYPPGSRVKYSNAALAVVGAVVESRLDQSHPEYVSSHILIPLGMNHASFERPEDHADLIAAGWMRTYDGPRFVAPDFPLGTGPAGNLYASANDLGAFLLAVLGHSEPDDSQVLTRESWLAMTTPQLTAFDKPSSFGLGFHVGELDGEKLIGHGGAVYGFSTEIAALPQHGIGVAAVTNLDGANGVVERIRDYALRLCKAVQLHERLPDYERTTSIAAPRAQAMVGRFRNPSNGSWAEVHELGGRVFLRAGVFRHELRAKASDGGFVVDDNIAFGRPVTLLNNGNLTINGELFVRQPDEPPADVPAQWNSFIGEYGWDYNTLYILEEEGQLYALIEWFYYYPLTALGSNQFAFPDFGLYHGEKLIFEQDQNGEVLAVTAAEVRFPKRAIGTRDGETFRIEPIRPIEEIRPVALEAKPPTETGDFRNSNLVELVQFEPGLHLDVRYATTNNFMGVVFYDQPRAFMQQPAAEAVSKAHQSLAPRGLGLLVHDAYRPWHVTKMFWDATPDSMKDFVANPANGSRHNRGCAVDLTLFDINTGQPIQMVAGYDEFSRRSYPAYPGGTSRQRWYRDTLRRAMELAGFSVYEFEWWHFDYQDWRQYRIQNLTFEQLDGRQ